MGRGLEAMLAQDQSISALRVILQLTLAAPKMPSSMFMANYMSLPLVFHTEIYQQNRVIRTIANNGRVVPCLTPLPSLQAAPPPPSFDHRHHRLARVAKHIKSQPFPSLHNCSTPSPRASSQEYPLIQSSQRQTHLLHQPLDQLQHPRNQNPSYHHELQKHPPLRRSSAL